MMPVTIALIPPEIVEQVLLFLDPLDVASFSQTCKRFYDLVYPIQGNHLWRMLYMAQPLDDPRRAFNSHLDRPAHEGVDWKGTLQAIIRARTVLRDPSKCRPGERDAVLRTLIKMLRDATPATATSDGGNTPSENLVWLGAMLRDGAFLTYSTPGSTEEEVQMRAYLLVHLGLTPCDTKNDNKAAALACIYDLRNYGYDSNFGPYMADGSGRINWVHLHAIHRAIAMHLVDLREDEPFVFPLIPISMPYCQSVIPPGMDLATERDWAGVEGLWHCSFSFIDHRDLIQINDSKPDEQGPLDIKAFQDSSFHETFRVLPVHFHLIGAEKGVGYPNRPRLMFAGEVRDGQTMVGRVEMTPDGHLRWKWVCGQGGQTNWSCDGIQIGGVRSSYGILGSWTTFFHEHLDPVGPLWMHKVN